jgi:hypothetical protein
MRYYFTPIRMTTVKQTITSVGPFGKKLEYSDIASGNAK